MQEAVSQRILRRVSTRDYAGVLEDVCDGYGIDKSSVSRHWKAASRQQLQEMLERPLGELDLCVLFLDGKEFHDFTLIVAMGVDRQGRKHVLGLWSGPTENAVVCRFGSKGLILRCRVHKKRNIQKYLPQKYHGMLSMKLHRAWGMTEYDKAYQELRQGPRLAGVDQLGGGAELGGRAGGDLDDQPLGPAAAASSAVRQHEHHRELLLSGGGSVPWCQTLARWEHGPALGGHRPAGG
jgi:transposase-like protein